MEPLETARPGCNVAKLSYGTCCEGADATRPTYLQRYIAPSKFAALEKPVVQWSDNSAPTKVISFRFPAWLLVDFRTRGSLRTMPLVDGFSQGSPVSSPFHSSVALYSPLFTFIGSQGLHVESNQNLSGEPPPLTPSGRVNNTLASGVTSRHFTPSPDYQVNLTVSGCESHLIGRDVATVSPSCIHPPSLPHPLFLRTFSRESLQPRPAFPIRQENTTLEIKGCGKREIPEKTLKPAESSGTILTCKNSGVTQSGIEPNSSWWEASWLTTQTTWSRLIVELPSSFKLEAVTLGARISYDSPSDAASFPFGVRGTWAPELILVNRGQNDVPLFTRRLGSNAIQHMRNFHFVIDHMSLPGDSSLPDWDNQNQATPTVSVRDSLTDTYNAPKRGTDKGDTAMHPKGVIASNSKAENWPLCVTLRSMLPVPSDMKCEELCFGHRTRLPQRNSGRDENSGSCHRNYIYNPQQATEWGDWSLVRADGPAERTTLKCTCFMACFLPRDRLVAGLRGIVRAGGGECKHAGERTESSVGILEPPPVAATSCHWLRVSTCVGDKALWSAESKLEARRGRGGRAVSQLAFQPWRTGLDPRPSQSRISACVNRAERCLWAVSFLGDLPFTPALSIRRCSMLTSITLTGSEDLAVKSRPNIFNDWKQDLL
ncbi:hypothetical protein PR048_007250 [Dryococelus australis]|uniref:Uncharacterized protein n=1 Tax=Dryococelus australis TaxID=614101 RepID=A0ABQ9ID92_9NEOP|nr:hypothetical protein PR048_007250 [Dryococelus australis]